ncbi:MAG: rRNA pseudouridine synthase [Spirochaetaceae bacterium]|nr:MAG: rRNA pseudouridine synthase [Spirochaetaceae bacterium]
MAQELRRTKTPDFPLRLHVYMAKCGVCSRRQGEQLIAQGRVSVNGTVIRTQGTMVEEDDIVEYEGKRIYPTRKMVYLAVHKPPRMLSTSKDPEGRPIVMDLLKTEFSMRMFTVGRLDFLSSGLILVTNDGDFALATMHPSAAIEKEYLVETKRPVTSDMLDQFKRGIVVEGVRYSIDSYSLKTPFRMTLVLHEGKNREIRRVFQHWKATVKRIHRVRIGPVRIKGIASGTFRHLTDDEIQWFLRQTGGSR